MTAIQLFEKTLAVVFHYIAEQEDFPKIVQLNRNVSIVSTRTVDLVGPYIHSKERHGYTLNSWTMQGGTPSLYP